MEYSSIIFKKVDRVASVTLNRPDKLNALTEQMCKELVDVLHRVAEDDTIRVLVLTGAGRGFCAGADLGWFRDLFEQRKRGQVGYDVISWATDFRLALENVPQPTIASINGIALGGGMTMTLGFDIRIAAEEAKISFPFVSKVAVVPEIGSTYMLPRLVGIAKAYELVFTGKTITGKEAKEIGLVNEAVPLADLPIATSELARTIAQGSPLAARLAKEGLRRGLNSDLYSQVLWEQRGLFRTFQSEDHEEAIKAFFDKRNPEFKGR